MSDWTTTLPDYIRVGNNRRTKTGRETDLGGPENKPEIRNEYTARLGKANYTFLGSTPIKLKLCEPQGLCIIRAHTKFQLPT